MSLPILYSFRRCPYAMRARMAIAIAGITVELREVVLKNKPLSMLAVSPKATVPILVLPDGEVIDESLDIMDWSARVMSDQQSGACLQFCDKEKELQLIEYNDGDFKSWLDRYKYADRFPEKPMTYYRSQGEAFLSELEIQLASQSYLVDTTPSYVDIAIFPFVRQFAMVDLAWFMSRPFPRLQQWLRGWLEHDLFSSVMHKYLRWQDNSQGVIFPSS